MFKNLDGMTAISLVLVCVRAVGGNRQTRTEQIFIPLQFIQSQDAPSTTTDLKELGYVIRPKQVVDMKLFTGFLQVSAFVFDWLCS